MAIDTTAPDCALNRARIPVGEHGADVEPVVLADRDQGTLGNEGSQLARGQLSADTIQADPVCREEKVTVVSIKFRALVLDHRILDGHRVQAELGAQHLEIIRVRVAEIQPDHRRFVLEILADVGDRESLKLQHPVPVEPGAGLALGRREFAERGGGHLVGIDPAEGRLPAVAIASAVNGAGIGRIRVYHGDWSPDIDGMPSAASAPAGPGNVNPD